MLVFTAPETWPFGSALALMVGVSVIEGAGLLLSTSPSQWIDGLIPELPADVHGVLGWLHLGKVPFLVLLILFLAGFAICGYAVQTISWSIAGGFLPAWIAALPAALSGISTVRGVGALLTRVVPGDESSAVSELSLIGRAGVVIRGTARRGLAAEAKVRDTTGRMHYVMVEPDLDEQTFAEGDDVLLVRKVGARFHCIRNPHPALL
jgi:hypothetical protein